jgi:hypothetical protein
LYRALHMPGDGKTRAQMERLFTKRLTPSGSISRRGCSCSSSAALSRPGGTGWR